MRAIPAATAAGRRAAYPRRTARPTLSPDPMAPARPSLSSGDLLADRRFEYARLYAEAGDHGAAADLFAQALELAPGWDACRFALGEALAAAGDTAAAAAAFARLLERDPQDRFGARLQLALLGAAPVPPTAPEAYVRALFDDYADRFEAALVGDLGYRTPSEIAATIARLRPGARFARVLDLGCGTGLAGAALRPVADHLEGVDLSADMVANAAAKGVYDDLRVGEVVAHLRAGTEPIDLIVAADVFVYVGDLCAIFAAAAERLAPGGLFAFSVERADESEAPEGWRLGASLRYAHTATHVEDLAGRNGLALVTLAPTTLRMDRGEPVAGYVAVAAACGGAPFLGADPGAWTVPTSESGTLESA